MKTNVQRNRLKAIAKSKKKRKVYEKLHNIKNNNVDKSIAWALKPTRKGMEYAKRKK